MECPPAVSEGGAARVAAGGEVSGIDVSWAVRRDGVMVADVIQVWLDVLNHPTRGQEQAEHIFRKVLRALC